MSELKPCPFCGGEAKFVHIFENPEKCMVSCRECDGGIDAVFANEEAAAEAWNRRVQPANEPLTLEQLREMYGEPVWVACGIYKDWRIPEFIDEGGYKGFIKFTDRSAEPISDYGKNWLAYGHKPGGEQE